jgi:hypothetical protein
MGIAVNDETMVFGDLDGIPKYNGKNQFLVYRKNDSGWEFTDKIIPEDLPEVREKGTKAFVSISNNVLVISAEQKTIPVYGNVRYPIEDINMFLKYPGRVCIYRLLPGKGYVLEDVIGRERGTMGKPYFKSVLAFTHR